MFVMLNGLPISLIDSANTAGDIGVTFSDNPELIWTFIMKKKNISNTARSAHEQAIKNFEQDLNQYLRKRHRHNVNYIFNILAKWIADVVGNAWTFVFAVLIVIGWGIAGRYFHYSDTWQLGINTGTNIVTFLIVFLIQSTQNRDTEILNLKIDELIRSHKGARNLIINLNELSDIELKELEKEYIKLKDKRTGK